MWVKVSEKIFNERLSIITEAKNNELKVNVDGKEITLDKAESLLKDISSEKRKILAFKKKFMNLKKNSTILSKMM